MKKISLLVAFGLSACAFGRGARPPANVKIYVVEPDDSYCRAEWCRGKVGLVRTQAQEVKSFEKSKGFYALSPEDLQVLISQCPQP